MTVTVINRNLVALASRCFRQLIAGFHSYIAFGHRKGVSTIAVVRQLNLVTGIVARSLNNLQVINLITSSSASLERHFCSGGNVRGLIKHGAALRAITSGNRNVVTGGHRRLLVLNHTGDTQHIVIGNCKAIETKHIHCVGVTKAMLIIVAAARASCGNLTDRSQRFAITNDFHIDCIGVKLIAIMGLSVNSQLAGHADFHILDTVQVDITVLFSTDFDLVASIIDLELTGHSHIALIRHCKLPGIRQAIPSGIHRLTGAVSHHNFCCLIANGRLQSHGHFCSVLGLAGNINVTGPHTVSSLVRLGHSNDIAVSRLGRLIRQLTIRRQNSQSSCHRKRFFSGSNISCTIKRRPVIDDSRHIIIACLNILRKSHIQRSQLSCLIAACPHIKPIGLIVPTCNIISSSNRNIQA